MTTISKTRAVQLIKEYGTRMFSVDFTKVGGEKRTINGRIGVRKGAKGTGNKTNVKEMGYIRVYEQPKPGTNIKAGRYRLVNVQTMSGLRINKKDYKIK